MLFIYFIVTEGDCMHFLGRQLSKLILSPLESEKGSTVEGKNLLPLPIGISMLFMGWLFTIKQAT